MLQPSASSLTTRPFGGNDQDSLGLSGPAKCSSAGLNVSKLPPDFADLLIELSESGAEFLVVGGWAVVLYGHVRATDDLDVFVRPSLSNSERVFAALEAFGAPLAAHGVSRLHFATEGDAYRFGVPPLNVELLTRISGVSFDEAAVDSNRFELDGRLIPYIGRRALIANKKSAARYKDLADVEELERIEQSTRAKS